MVGAGRAEYCRGKGFLVGRVGVIFGFEAESVVIAVGTAVPALYGSNQVAAVKMEGRLGCKKREAAAGRWVGYFSRLP